MQKNRQSNALYCNLWSFLSWKSLLLHVTKTRADRRLFNSFPYKCMEKTLLQLFLFQFVLCAINKNNKCWNYFIFHWNERSDGICCGVLIVEIVGAYLKMSVGAVMYSTSPSFSLYHENAWLTEPYFLEFFDIFIKLHSARLFIAVQRDLINMINGLHKLIVSNHFIWINL